MPEYRRLWVPGGTYAFTVNLADRSQCLLAEHFNVLRDAACVVRRRHPFEIVAWAVMPNHLHAVWTLPDGDHDFAMRWMLIKQSFSRAMPVRERITASRLRRNERGIWQFGRMGSAEAEPIAIEAPMMGIATLNPSYKGMVASLIEGV